MGKGIAAMRQSALWEVVGKCTGRGWVSIVLATKAQEKLYDIMKL